MEHIPKEDLDEMDLDEQMNSDQEEEEDEETEEEPEVEQKEIFIPGKHKLEEGEELVRDERFVLEVSGLKRHFFINEVINDVIDFKLNFKRLYTLS